MITFMDTNSKFNSPKPSQALVTLPESRFHTTNFVISSHAFATPRQRSDATMRRTPRQPVQEAAGLPVSVLLPPSSLRLEMIGVKKDRCP